MIDRAAYSTLRIAKLHEFEVEIDPTHSPDYSEFVILCETEDGKAVAIAIPFSELSDLPEALASAAMKAPGGPQLQ